MLHSVGLSCVANELWSIYSFFDMRYDFALSCGLFILSLTLLGVFMPFSFAAGAMPVCILVPSTAGKRSVAIATRYVLGQSCETLCVTGLYTKWSFYFLLLLQLRPKKKIT